MKKKIKKSGQTVVEVLIALAIFSLLVAVVTTMTTGAYGTNLRISQRENATALVKEGLEAVRSIRDYNWQNLVDGTYGLSYQNGYWEFSSNQEIIGSYTRKITISSLNREKDYCGTLGPGGISDPDIKKVSVSVEWPIVAGKSTAIVLSSYFSNWQNPVQKSCRVESPGPICENLEIGIILNYYEDKILDYTGKTLIIKNGGGIKMNGRNLTLITNCNLIIEQGGFINSDGNQLKWGGGTINLIAKDITVNGLISANSAYIINPAGPRENRKAGNINISADNLSLGSVSQDNGNLRANGLSLDSPGGNITFDLNKTLSHQGRISASAFNVSGYNETLDGGRITIRAKKIITSSLSEILSNIYSSIHGRAGILDIEARETIDSSDSQITALSLGKNGYGGQISLKADDFLKLRSDQVLATGGKSDGLITLTYCQKDFTGTIFKPSPKEIEQCP